MVYFLFVVGFLLLLKGADWLVEGSSAIAKKYGLSPLIIGLTIVSFGTSLPELVINVLASLKGSSDIAIGNIIGSNISNLLLILGISAIIYPIAVKRSVVFSEIPFSLAAVTIMGLLGNIVIFQGVEKGAYLSRFDGFILLFYFALFLGYIIRVSKDDKDFAMHSDMEIHKIPLLKSFIFILAGITSLFIGGEWTVEGAIHVAREFGLTEEFIGLTVIAIGTSLPELVTSAVAAYKKDTEIALGNIIGSNIFNVLWILGISAIINPLEFTPSLNDDLLIVVFATSLIFVILPFSKTGSMERPHGILFVLLYVLYLAYLVFNT
jgi:cation:H+ antiporter